MKSLKDTEAAYLAGLLDGEGCIGALASAGGWFRPIVEVCMTNPRPLQWAVQISGIGCFYTCKLDRRGTRRQAYKWVISRPSDAAELLKQILPFMHVKRGEALAFCTMASIRALTPRGYRRKFPGLEADAAAVIALLKSNGGAPSLGALQASLDLAAGLRQAIEERGK